MQVFNSTIIVIGAQLILTHILVLLNCIMLKHEQIPEKSVTNAWMQHVFVKV